MGADDISYRLRSARPGDYAFLYDLHRKALGESIAASWGWDESKQKQLFDDRFDPARTQVIVLDNNDVGELAVEDRGCDLFVTRLLLLPEHQRKGIGTAVVWELLEEAQRREIPIRISLAKPNPARAFWERLGFVLTGEDRHHYFLVASPMELPARVGALRVPILRLEGGAGLPLPTYQSEGAVGMDLHAAVAEDVLVEPGAIAAIPCGFAIAVPSGYEAQIRPRSGLALRGLTVINTPGTIDSDYRGEIKVLLIHLGKEAFRVTRAMRIAQMLLLPVPRVEWEEAKELPPTQRGAGGFGHTGV